MLRELLNALLALTGCLFTLGVVVTGMAFMVNPETGRNLLKNLAVAGLMFALGLLLFKWCTEVP